MSNKLLVIIAGIVLLLGAITISVFAITKDDTIVLTKTNFTSIVGEVNGTSIGQTLDAISKSDPKQTFYIYLQSPGGSVFAGKQLVDYLKSTDRKIVCIGNTAISMAFVILQACPTRIVTEDAVLMSHQISTGMEGSLKQVKAAVTLMEKLEKLYDTMIAKRLKLSLEDYRAKIDPEFWMLGSEDILSNKAADSVAKVKCETSIEKEEVTKLVQGFFGLVEVKVKVCPLL